MVVSLTLLVLNVSLTNAKQAKVQDGVPTETSGVCEVAGGLLIAGDETVNQFWWQDIKSEKIEGITVPDIEWEDMEDLARVDDQTFFALTSMSRKKKSGNRHSNREKLILFSIVDHPGKGLKSVSMLKTWQIRESLIDFLQQHMSNSIDVKLAESEIPQNGGLNVEGLAYYEGVLVLGLRSPLTKEGKAILIFARNGKEILKGDSPIWAETRAVPLGRQGIRSLYADKEGLVLLAGSPGYQEEVFSLTLYNLANHTMSPLSVPRFSNLARPEGVTRTSVGEWIFVQDWDRQNQNPSSVVRTR